MDEQFASAVNANKAYWNEVGARIEALRAYARIYPRTVHIMKLDNMAASKDPKAIRELANALFDNCLSMMITMPTLLPRSEINDTLAIMVQLNLILTILE